MNIRKNRDAIEKIEWMRNFLAFMLVGAFVGAIPLFVFAAIPKESEQIITYMVGQLSGMALTALGFYFVSKVGSDALDAKRAENTGKLADAVVAAATTSTSDTPVPANAIEGAQAATDAAQEKVDDLKTEAPKKGSKT